MELSWIIGCDCTNLFAQSSCAETEINSPSKKETKLVGKKLQEYSSCNLFFRSWFLLPSDFIPPSRIFLFPGSVCPGRQGANLLTVCISPRRAGATPSGDPARGGMAPPMSGHAQPPLQGTARYALYQFGTSGAAVAVATAVTHPLDVIKIRLQMQLAGQRGNLVGMGAIFTQMVEREGPRSLYLGFPPALMRSLIYGGLRLGLYEPCKHVCSYAFGSTNFAFKFASGVVAGALATALTNPMEVLKVRSQMSKSRISTVGMVRKIVAEEGLKALWKGVGPAMVRAGCLTASQMATYDEAKQALLKLTPLEEGFQLHLMSSCIAGTAGTLVTAPIDMIKTRLMLQKESKGVRVYRNGFHCAYQVVLTEGVKSLYKGGFATFARLGPQTAITFIACEKLRELVGMTAI